MMKYDKECLQQLLKDEQQVMKALEKNYIKALADVKTKVQLLMAEAATTQLQSKIYQFQYQQALESQLSDFVNILQGGNVSTIEEYLKTCYNDAYIGNVYSLQQQKIPLLLPIQQEQVIKAISRATDGYTLSQWLYKNVAQLQQIVKAEISRGIASNLSYSDIARNISSYSEADMNKAKRIARTEGHRVQNEARYDSMQAAKAKGADIVKQWDSTLDGKTRPEHRQLDGQVRELDEPFEVAGYKGQTPGGFGSAYMDCNCRCCMLQRARWAVSKEKTYTKWNNQDGGFIECSGYEDFKKKYLVKVSNLAAD